MKRMLALSAVCALFSILRLQGQIPEKSGLPKIGYTSVEFVLGRLPESKVMQSQLEVTRAQMEKAIDESIKEFQVKGENYQKAGSQMTDIIRADKEKELENLQNRIQEMRNKAQQSLQNKQQQLIEPIITKVNSAIQEVGKENSYIYVFNMDGGQGATPFILFSATEDNNVTNLILKKLGVNPEEPDNTKVGIPAAKPEVPKPLMQNSPAPNKK